jgi:hypothetical protein
LTKDDKGQTLSNILWNVEMLEETIDRRKKILTKRISKSIVMQDNLVTASLLRVTDNIVLEEWENDQLENNILNVSPEKDVRQQVVCAQADTILSKSHLPIPVPLRARAERRSISEMEAGRPGIILKPKINPLEGDTSLRYGHGKWWKKDCSAVHSVPRVDIKAIKYHPSSFQYALLLGIQNPTLGPIRLKVGAVLQENRKFPDCFEVILDPLTFHKVKVDLILTTSAKPLASNTEQIVIEPAEDLYFDVGKSHLQSSLDDKKDEWINADNIDWSEGNTCRLLTVSHDVAWVQYVTDNIQMQELQDRLDSAYFGVPIELAVEVSDESWESSLIQVEEKTGAEKDFVSLIILPVWKHQAC